MKKSYDTYLKDKRKLRSTVVLKKKLFMTLMKVGKADFIQGDTTTGFRSRGKRSGSTLNTKRKSEIVQPRSRV